MRVRFLSLRVPNKESVTMNLVELYWDGRYQKELMIFNIAR